MPSLRAAGVSPRQAWNLLKRTTWRTDYSIDYSHVSGTKWRCEIAMQLNLDAFFGLFRKPGVIPVPVALVDKDAVYSDVRFCNEDGCRLSVTSLSQGAAFAMKALDGALLEKNSPPLGGTELGEALFNLFRRPDLLNHPGSSKGLLTYDGDYVGNLRKAVLSYFEQMRWGGGAYDRVWTAEEIEAAKKDFGHRYDNDAIFRYFVRTYTSKRPVYVVLEGRSLRSKSISGGFFTYRGVVRKRDMLSVGLMRFGCPINLFGRKFEKSVDAFGMAEHVQLQIKSPQGTYFAPVSLRRGKVEMPYRSEQGGSEKVRPEPQVKVTGSISPSQVTLDSVMRWDFAPGSAAQEDSGSITERPYRRVPDGRSLEQAYLLQVRLMPEYKGTFLSVLAFFFLSIVAMLFLFTSYGGGSSSHGLQSLFAVAPIIMTTFLSRRRSSYIEESVSWIQRGLFGAGVAIDVLAVLAFCCFAVPVPGAQAQVSAAIHAVFGGVAWPEPIASIIANTCQSHAFVFLVCGVALAVLLLLYCAEALLVGVRKLCWTKGNRPFGPRPVQWIYDGEIITNYRESDYAQGRDSSRPNPA